jgi:hypothetical protein
MIDFQNWETDLSIDLSEIPISKLPEIINSREMFVRWSITVRLDDFKELSEGSPLESINAGYFNALDTEEDRGYWLTDSEFLEITFSEFRNMGYHQEFNHARS